MRIEFSDMAQTVHDYLLWSWDCDAKGWEGFSKGKCSEVGFKVALQIYSEEVDYYLKMLTNHSVSHRIRF